MEKNIHDCQKNVYMLDFSEIDKMNFHGIPKGTKSDEEEDFYVYVIMKKKFYQFFFCKFVANNKEIINFIKTKQLSKFRKKKVDLNEKIEKMEKKINELTMENQRLRSMIKNNNLYNILLNKQNTNANNSYGNQVNEEIPDEKNIQHPINGGNLNENGISNMIEEKNNKLNDQSKNNYFINNFKNILMKKNESTKKDEYILNTLSNIENMVARSMQLQQNNLVFQNHILGIMSNGAINNTDANTDVMPNANVQQNEIFDFNQENVQQNDQFDEDKEYSDNDYKVDNENIIDDKGNSFLFDESSIFSNQNNKKNSNNNNDNESNDHSQLDGFLDNSLSNIDVNNLFIDFENNDSKEKKRNNENDDNNNNPKKKRRRQC